MPHSRRRRAEDRPQHAPQVPVKIVGVNVQYCIFTPNVHLDETVAVPYGVLWYNLNVSFRIVNTNVLSL